MDPNVYRCVCVCMRMCVCVCVCVLGCVPSTGVQEKLGVMNKGTVYALWEYEAQDADELSFHEGDPITILRRKDDSETDWWWGRLNDKEGYVPRNLIGVRTQIYH